MIGGRAERQPGDFNGDGEVGFPDFIMFSSAFGATEADERYNTEFDIDENGEIGFSDFVSFASLFGTVYGN